MPSIGAAQRILLAGLTLLLALLWFAHATRSAPAPTARPAHGAASAMRSGAVHAVPAPVLPAVSTPTPDTRAATAASLVAAFQSSDNLRAFIHEALAQPQQGGVFYALRAVSECRRQQGTQVEADIDASTSLGHAELVRRANWAALSARRCASLTADDLADGEVQRLLALGEARGDPLVGAYRGWLTAVEQGSIDALVSAMQRVLQRADPALLEWVAVAGIDYLDGSRGAAGPLDDLARRRRVDAWALLPCEFGADCARPDFGTASPCIGAGRCEGGRRAEVLARGAWQNDAERASLAAEIDALKSAVMARDARAALGLPKP